MTLYKRSELPGNIQKYISETSHKKRRLHVPRWLEDDEVRNRVLQVYSMYISRQSIQDIVEVCKISITQIYRDITRAREMRKILFLGEIENLLMEQVESRKQIIQEARTSLTQLREGMTVIIPGESENTEQNIEERTPQRARAEADLLRVISEQEKAIEELLGLRHGDRVGIPESPFQGPTLTVVVDARTQTLKLPNGRDTKNILDGDKS